MSEITRDLLRLGLDIDDLETRLGMDAEEIERFRSHALEAEQLLKDVDGFGQAWEPVHIAGITDDEEFLRELERSKQAAKEMKAHQEELAAREREIEAHLEATLQQRQDGKKALTQDQKEKLRQEIARGLLVPEPPKPPSLRKVIFFVTEEEYRVIMDAWGDDLASSIVSMARGVLDGNTSKA